MKARLKRVPELLKQFRQSVLTQAVTGKLTEDWRGKNKHVKTSREIFEDIIQERTDKYQLQCVEAKNSGNRKPRKIHLDNLPQISEIDIDIPRTWAQTNVNFLAHVTKLAGFEYTKYFDLQPEGDIPVVRAQNVRMGYFEEKNLVYIDQETSDLLERSQLKGREILMVFIGAGTGSVCLAPADKRWHLAPNVAKIDVDGIDENYLCYYLQSSLGNANTLSFSKATAQQSLSMGTIREITTIVPPPEEQKEIVRRVESLFEKADLVERQYEQLKEKIEHLPQAILAKAFRGELVPQHPNDEPAEELLQNVQHMKPNGLPKQEPVAKASTSPETKASLKNSKGPTDKSSKGRPLPKQLKLDI